MTSAKKKNQLPPALVSNLQDVLRKKVRDGDESKNAHNSYEPPLSSSADSAEHNLDLGPTKPVILLTNIDGIDSCGLTYLVDALDSQGFYSLYVCVPQSIKSFAGHSITIGQTLEVSSVKIKGAIGYEVSGTPADCISLALSGTIFPSTKPLLVVSGINKGSCCGSNVFYSGSVAGAREALFHDIPSLSLSLNWKKNESEETIFKDAVTVCLPLINAAARDIKEGVFPEGCSLKVEIPSSPLANKGFKLTRQSRHGVVPLWQAISPSRAHAPPPSMSSHQSLAFQLAKLSRDASAAGAARRESSQRKNVEIESTGAAEMPESNQAVKKYFRLEFSEKKNISEEGDDVKALENGFIAVTPLFVNPYIVEDTEKAAAQWLSNSLGGNH